MMAKVTACTTPPHMLHYLRRNDDGGFLAAPACAPFEIMSIDGFDLTFTAGQSRRWQKGRCGMKIVGAGGWPIDWNLNQRLSVPLDTANAVDVKSLENQSQEAKPIVNAVDEIEISDSQRLMKAYSANMKFQIHDPRRLDASSEEWRDWSLVDNELNAFDTIRFIEGSPYDAGQKYVDISSPVHMNDLVIKDYLYRSKINELFQGAKRDELLSRLDASFEQARGRLAELYTRDIASMFTVSKADPVSSKGHFNEVQLKQRLEQMIDEKRAKLSELMNSSENGYIPVDRLEEASLASSGDGDRFEQMSYRDFVLLQSSVNTLNDTLSEMSSIGRDAVTQHTNSLKLLIAAAKERIVLDHSDMSESVKQMLQQAMDAKLSSAKAAFPVAEQTGTWLSALSKKSSDAMAFRNNMEEIVGQVKWSMIREYAPAQSLPYVTSELNSLVKDWNSFIKSASFISASSRSKLLLPETGSPLVDVRV